jgi:hypothetical protein
MIVAGKRRKVRCQLSSENVSVCSGCLARGTTCLSQEYPEEYYSSSSPNVGERLGRVEQLLEKLVEKITAFEEVENAHKIQTPESMGDVLTPYSSNATSNIQDAIPILSLFDNEVVKETRYLSSKLANYLRLAVETMVPKSPPPYLNQQVRRHHRVSLRKPRGSVKLL